MYCDVFLVGGACVCVLVVGAGSHLSDMSSGSPFAVGNFKHVYFQRTGLSGGLVVKNPHANAGNTRDTGLIPVLGRYPGVGNGNPL